jgi:hypothetical protein
MLDSKQTKMTSLANLAGCPLSILGRGLVHRVQDRPALRLHVFVWDGVKSYWIVA